MRGDEGQPCAVQSKRKHAGSEEDCLALVIRKNKLGGNGSGNEEDCLADVAVRPPLCQVHFVRLMRHQDQCLLSRPA